MLPSGLTLRKKMVIGLWHCFICCVLCTISPILYLTQRISKVKGSLHICYNFQVHRLTVHPIPVFLFQKTLQSNLRVIGHRIACRFFGCGVLWCILIYTPVYYKMLGKKNRDKSTAVSPVILGSILSMVKYRMESCVALWTKFRNKR